MITLKNIASREILDSRGFPTVEVEVTVASLRFPNQQVTGRAQVPSGASTGEGEALELRDHDPKRYLGKGVLKAVENIRAKIKPAFEGKKFSSQTELDQKLCELDGTPNKACLGANAVLGVSMAYLKACALAEDCPTDVLIAKSMGTSGMTLPTPLMNILNGGKHADNGLAIQEFMIVPVGFDQFSRALQAGCEIFHHLKKILHTQGLSTAVGDEGGFAPVLKGEKTHEQALDLILKAVETAGYRPGQDILLALDSAASEFSPEAGKYQFEGELLTADELIQIYKGWTKKYPIISIEDGLAEHDWEGWQSLSAALSRQCQLVGDDLFVTNPIFLKRGIEKKIANSILIKLNQIGTVTETLETMKLAHQNQYCSVISHRSGETEDTFIADLAVGSDAGQIKTGSASRTDRIAKYNQLLRLEERLAKTASFAGMKPFKKFKR